MSRTGLPMNSKIITTTKTRTRYPAVSFFLSLAFTGLGQVYNGELSRGIIFFSLRTVVLLAAPLFALTAETHSHLQLFSFTALGGVLLALLSAGEAFVSSLNRKEIRLQPCNSFFGYGSFVFITVALTLLNLLISSTLFSVKNLDAEKPGPVLQKGDLVLTARLIPGQYGPGDLVLYDNSTGRIIAEGGDRARYAGNVFWVNGRALPLTIFADRQMERLALPVNADVLAERIGDIRYPVATSEELERLFLTFRVPEGSVLVAGDDRRAAGFAKVTDKNRIEGRIEGVLWSSSLSRIFLKPHISNILLDE